jgi:hypothetical protein
MDRKRMDWPWLTLQAWAARSTSLGAMKVNVSISAGGGVPTREGRERWAAVP